MVFVVCYILFFSVPKFTLSLLQINFLKQERRKTPYILESQAFLKAADYASVRERIAMASILVDMLLIIFWIFFGLSALDSALEFSPLIKSVVFVLCFLVVGILANLPFEAYQTLVTDKKFGFAKGGVKLFILDNLKSFALLLVVGGILILIFSWIILEVQFWEVYAFVFGVVLIVGVNFLYPLLIAPMFNQFTPLRNTELKDEINHLLKRVGFQSKGVFVMDASKRDGRLNAYFAGLGRAKRVILFDTLLDKIPHPSILAVLGHELGHFKHYDIYKMMVLVLGFFGALLFMVTNLPESLFSSANVERNVHTLIVFLLLLSAPIGFYFMLLVNWKSCQNEFAADRFGASLTSAESLANALLVLVKENNSFPLAHPLYMRFFYSHPPLMARLLALGCQDLAKR
ncbi:M48 family metallopeptidase [uncultured Helicobacter sp.]|uniref:M48 family metallopeptidase n=1 Tax=uncultured Helicobacter sp. TaxID=175537 RepID=UPI0026174D7C|nr:M48 family metallopeptidase [uncultured Helicobacter sp.]